MDTTPGKKETKDIPVNQLKKHTFQEILPELLRKKFLLALVLIPILLLLYKTLGETVFNQSQEKEFLLSESYPDDISSVSTITQPTFVFSKKLSLSEKDIPKYFHISPTPKGAWHIEPNRQVVYFATDKKIANAFSPVLNYNTLYTVRIDKSLSAQGGQNLGKDKLIVFRTDTSPKFGLSPEKKLINVQPNTEIATTLFSNYPLPGQQPMQKTYKVTVETATMDQVLTYFSHPAKKLSAYTFTRNENNKTVQTFSKTLTIQDTQTVKTIPISGLNNPGMYHVTISNASGSEDFFINVTNLVAQTFTDMSSMNVWVTNRQGNALQNADVQYYNLQTNPNALATSSSNVDGLTKSTKDIASTDMVVVTKGNDSTVIKTTSFTRQTEQETLTAYTYTDRPVYQPGDTVHYKAVIRKRTATGFVIPDTQLYIRLAANFDDGLEQNFSKATMDANGTITADFVLQKSMLGQYPNIQIATKSTQAASQTDSTENQKQFQTVNSLSLQVQSYRKPDLDISIITTKQEYISGDQAKITVLAKTLYGKPLGNIPFSYRVVGSDFTEIKDRSYENIDGSYLYYYGDGHILASGSSVFDKMGKNTISFPTQLGDLEYSQTAVVEITPKIAASPSIAKTVLLIHRGDYAVFFGDDISANTKDGVRGTIETLNHEKPRHPVGNRETTITLNKVVDYRTTTFVEKQDVKTDDSGKTTFSFPKLDKDSYELVAESKDDRGNTITARYQFYADEYSINTTNQYAQDVMQVTTDKKEYKAGANATIFVSNTKSLNDIIVLTAVADNQSAQSKLLSLTKKSVNGTRLSFSIPIPKNQINQILVMVYATSGGAVTSGTATITINNDDKKLQTSVTFDKQQYRPGDTAKATIQTKDKNGNPVASDTSLAVIDAALLQIREAYGDIFSTFYGADVYPSIVTSDSTQGIYTDQEGGGGGGCFLKGTKIHMADGSQKAIEDVAVGDQVLTRESQGANLLVPDTVTKTYRHIVTEYLTINERLNITPIHRLLVNNQWETADQIRIGDTLLDMSGNFIPVTSVTKHTGTFAVYNLTIKNTHTFFASDIYVHNDKGPAPRTNLVDTAYWNPHVATDQNGKAIVSFKIPDNITTFSAAAVTNTKDSLFGQDATSIVTQKDIVIIPTLPNFFYQKDKAAISALVQNNTKKDVHMNFTISAKDLQFSKTQRIDISPGDFQTVSVLIPITTTQKTTTFLYEAKDVSSGTVLDSLQLQKPVLPQGNISASWHTYTGSTDIVFTPQNPSFDFDSLTINLAPHIAQHIVNMDIGLNQSPSANGGEQLTSISYILGKTRDGFIAPHLYKYGQLKNAFREAVQSILAQRKKTTNGTDYWMQSDYGTETNLLTTAWITQGLKQAQEAQLLTDITNAGAIIDSAKRSVADPTSLYTLPPSLPPVPVPTYMPEIVPQGIPPLDEETVKDVVPSELPPTESSSSGDAQGEEVQGARTIAQLPDQTSPGSFNIQTMPFPTNNKYTQTPEEKLIVTWVLGQTNIDNEKNASPALLAVLALNGNKNALETLKEKRLTSSDDRYLWVGSSKYDQFLPALAMVEKGGNSDATKAIKGLSILMGDTIGTYDSSLALLAGAKDAIRQHYTVGKAATQVKVNDVLVYDTAMLNSWSSLSFSQVITAQNDQDAKIAVSVSAKGSLPVYTTVTEMQYGTPVQEEQKTSWLTQLFSGHSEGVVKPLSEPLHREIQDLIGKKINQIENGESGIVDLWFENPFTGTESTPQSQSPYAIIAEDAISPSYMYLDQSSGNSPQYQSVLQSLFDGAGQTSTNGSSYTPLSYTTPSDYSQETVFFNDTTPPETTIHLPYVVFNVSEGTYYQPKTTLVYPILGLILYEK